MYDMEVAILPNEFFKNVMYSFLVLQSMPIQVHILLILLIYLMFSVQQYQVAIGWMVDQSSSSLELAECITLRKVPWM